MVRLDRQGAGARLISPFAYVRRRVGARNGRRTAGNGTRATRSWQQVFCSALAALVLLVPATADAHEGWGILVDARGRIYFTDIPTNTIWRISESGRLEKIVEGKHSHALHMDAGGNLYGTNPHMTLAIGSIWKVTPQGTVSDVLVPTPDLPIGLQSFAMDSRGAVYSVNARSSTTPLLVLMRRNPDGSVQRVAGSEPGHADGTGAAAQFLGIDGMAWGPDGALFVADGAYVRKVTTGGVVTTPIASPLTGSSFGEDLMGIAADGFGSIVIADYSGRRVVWLFADSSVVVARGTPFPWAPTGVAVKDGAVYVLEHLRLPFAILGDLGIGPYLRVERIAADGTMTTLETLWGRRTMLALMIPLSVVLLTFALFQVSRRVRARRKRQPAIVGPPFVRK